MNDYTVKYLLLTERLEKENKTLKLENTQLKNENVLLKNENSFLVKYKETDYIKNIIYFIIYTYILITLF